MPSGRPLIAGLRAGQGDPQVSGSPGSGMRLSQGGGRGEAAHERGSGGCQVQENSILEDTDRHCRERGGVDKKKVEHGPCRELSMYLQGKEGEEEVLWMRVGIRFSVT